jgi:hypothetical protein
MNHPGPWGPTEGSPVPSWARFRRRLMEHGVEPSEDLRTLGEALEALGLTDVLLLALQVRASEDLSPLQAAAASLEAVGDCLDDLQRDFLATLGLALVLADVLLLDWGTPDAR